MTIHDILHQLRALATPERQAGMARAGINNSAALGVRLPDLRQLAKTVGKDHALALQLWDTGIHEARILASLIADPKQTTTAQMNAWAATFSSWDVTDQCAINLFRKTPQAYEMAATWAQQEAEFVKRAGFALMATLAVHDKHVEDHAFAAFFPLIEQAASDSRNFVKKAVNWALRQIGKRNLLLNQQAIECAERLQQQASRSAQWIAVDALRELRSQAIQRRLKNAHV